MIDLIAGAALVLAVRKGDKLADPLANCGEPGVAAAGADRKHLGRFATIGVVSEERTDSASDTPHAMAAATEAPETVDKMVAGG